MGLSFNIEDTGQIVISEYETWECRGECAIEILSSLVENWPELFYGRKGGIWYEDSPPPAEWLHLHDLAFSSTKFHGTNGKCLPFPCPMSLRWPQVGIPNADAMMKELLDDTTPFLDSRIFWIGAETHPSRRVLFELGQRHPERFDVMIMEWHRNSDGVQCSKTRQVSIPEHRRYKYLIDCPGNGYSARIKWLLATGRPLFIVERKIVEHWHDELKPWVHYIPVAADLSNLLEHHERVEADPTLYESLCCNARSFAAEHLTMEARLIHSAEAVRAAAHAKRLPLIPLPDDEISRVVHAPDVEMIVEIFRDFLAGGNMRLWIIDERVFCDGGWSTFRNSFTACEADLLATELRTHAEEPTWHHWSTLVNPNVKDRLETAVAALLPLMRVSRTAAEAVISGIEAGWAGHPEALIPSLVNRAGLRIEDVGGMGSFTPPDRVGFWYDNRTWFWQGPVEHVPGMLHFPVPRQKKALAAGRVRDRQSRIEDSDLKILYVSPVGGGAIGLLPRIVECFLAAGADCWLMQYDDAELAIPDGVRVIRDKGYKFPLALKYLHPDAVADYDIIFFWDDDLSVMDFDPRRFARIMLANRLEMAQPAILSLHGLSHRITKHQAGPPPWRDSEGKTVHQMVGRLTNFVEIMAPVFTREAWREFYGYLDPENRSGWGYDYIPLSRKGIVDAMPVVHTRAVQSINAGSEAEIRRFLDEQGLFRHAPVEHGWLFE